MRYLANKMNGYVKNPLSCEILKEFMDNLAEFPIDESFSTALFHCLKSSKFSPKGKICFLELVVQRFEKYIELFYSQIQSYNFQDPKQFLENISPPKQEEIVIPFDLQIDEDYAFKYKTKTVELESGFNLEDTSDDEIIHDQLVIKGLEDKVINHAFIDLVADYMEDFFSLNDQSCFQHFPLHFTTLILWTKSQAVLLIVLTSSQEIHLFMQLLD